MDRNKDGVVTIEEFIESCQKVRLPFSTFPWSKLVRQEKAPLDLFHPPPPPVLFFRDQRDLTPSPPQVPPYNLPLYCQLSPSLVRCLSVSLTSSFFSLSLYFASLTSCAMTVGREHHEVHAAL